jgi:hypothetical protein
MHLDRDRVADALDTSETVNCALRLLLLILPSDFACEPGLSMMLGQDEPGVFLARNHRRL